MSGEFAQVPGTDAASFETMDPSGFTDMAGQNLFGGNAANILQRGNDASMAWLMNSQNPGSFMNQYLGDFGNLTGAVTDATAPLSKQLNDQLQRNVQQGTEQVAQQMSGLGGLRSSGMADLAGQVAGREAAGAGTQLAQGQLGLLQPLANQQMLGRQYAMTNMMNQPMDLMGMQTQFGDPQYVAPQYYQQPGALDYLNSAGNLFSGIGSMIPGF